MRSGGLRVLFLAVTLAVMALAAVGFFADRVQQALSAERAAAIAADLVVEQGEPIPAEWIERAQQLGLQSSREMSFPSVLFLGEQPQLVRIKAVESNYPLRGRLEIVTAQGEPTGAPPGPGEAVAGARLLRLLADAQATVGLGSLQLRLVGRLVDEPDLGASLFQLAPRLLVSWQDAQHSGLLGPASRARYRLLLAGPAEVLRQYQAWIKKHHLAGTRILTAGDGRPELDTAIERARRFLSLAALCASLLAGVAIMLAARSFLEQSLDEAAILRTIGMTSYRLMRRHLARLLWLGLVSASLGVVLGWGLQLGLSQWLAGELGAALPAAGWHPIPVAFGQAAVLLSGFALPTLWSIRKVPPLRVLRRDLGPPGISRMLLVAMAFAAWLALVYWQIEDPTLTLNMGFALIGVALSLAGIGASALYVLRRWRRRSALPVGILAIVRQPGLVVLQLTGFGLGLSLLLLLGLVRSDLIDSWQRSLPADAPNYFLLNIQPGEAEALAARLQQAGIPDSGLFPSTRGRLVAINDRPVQPADYHEPRARRLASREYSLGFADHMQSDNRLLEGDWWRPGEEAFSVEQGVAQALGIRPGDRLQFDIAGQRVSATVRNLRSVEWDSFHVNFFVQGSAALLRNQGLPYAMITSLYLDEDGEGLLAALSRDFPGVSAISIGPLLGKVRAVIDRGAAAVEAVFLFTLGAALLVSIAALQLTRAQREQEIALLRTLGASRGQVRSALLVEFGGIGLIAGLVAMLVANGVGFWLGAQVFGIQYRPGLSAWLAGPLAGVVVLVLLAWLASRPLLSRPPAGILR